jgi:hypothetical protein
MYLLHLDIIFKKKKYIYIYILYPGNVVQVKPSLDY